MKGKKKSDLVVLLEYAGSFRKLTYLGLFLSAVAMILGMLPYICVWLVARNLIEVAPNWTEATNIGKYGWLAFYEIHQIRKIPCTIGRHQFLTPFTEFKAQIQNLPF